MKKKQAIMKNMVMVRNEIASVSSETPSINLILLLIPLNIKNNQGVWVALYPKMPIFTERRFEPTQL